MPEVFVGPLDRIDLAVSNALAGNPSGTGRALFSPDSLAPEERQLIAERFFGASDPGPMKAVLATTTNPTVILGAILTAKYPVDLSRSYATESAQFTTGLRRLVPVYDHIADFGEIYRGTALPKLLYKLGERVHVFHSEARDHLNAALNDYIKVAGKGPTKRNEQRIVYERLRREGSLAEQLEGFAARTEKVDTKLASKIREVSRNLPQLKLSGAEQALDKGWSRFFQHALEKTGVDRVDGVRDAIYRKNYEGPRVPGGARNPDDYWPLITKWDAASAKELQDVFIQRLTESGKKTGGFRLAGTEGKALTPSEMVRYFEDFQAINPGLTKTRGPEFESLFKQYMQNQIESETAGAPAKIASGTQLKRLNRMIPNPESLAEIGDEFKPLATTLRTAINEAAKHGVGAEDVQGASNLDLVPRVYRLDGTPTARIYANMRARDYGWSVQPDGWDRTVGERMNEAYKELKKGIKVDLEGNIIGKEATRTKNWISGAIVPGSDVPGAGGNQAIRASMWTDTFLPQIMGTTTYDETISSAWWDSMRVSAADKLTIVKTADGAIDEAASGKLGMALEKLGAGRMRESMVQGILNDSRFAQKPFNNAVAGYFYQSTLSLPNILSPVKNMFQTLTATAPRIGLKHTMVGIKDTLKGADMYTTLRFSGIDHSTSFAQAFPGFRETGLAMDEGLLRAMDKIHEGITAEKPIAAALQRAKQIGMSAFSTSEMSNRLIAYYGGRSAATSMYRKAAELGVEVDDFTSGRKMLLPKVAEAFAKDHRVEELVHGVATAIVHDTQGGGGVATIPAALAKVPPMFRQLMQFPIRYASQLLHGGAGELGRALVAGGVAAGALYAIFGEAGKKLATDATLFGAMPMPSDQGPFAPFPLVPPVLQLGGAAAQGLATGDFTNLQRSLPLLVPGGVGLSRMVSITGQAEIAGMIGKPVADYSRRTPDGRVPMMDKNGALVGFYTNTQLFAKSIGLGDVNAEQELSLNKWMEKYGQRVYSMRQDYLAALTANDFRKAQNIDTEYRRLNPGLGGIPVKPQHIQALAARRDVSRFERQLETLPPELRGQFAAVAGVSFGQSGAGFLGIPSEALTGFDTIKQRNPYRLQAPSGNLGSAANDLLANTNLGAFQ